MVWNAHPGLSWIEILAGYFDGFDHKLNKFWAVLSPEILWFLWKQRNEEVFQAKRRMLTEFNIKLTNYLIMMQVSVILEIPKSRFMILAQKGAPFSQIRHSISSLLQHIQRYAGCNVLPCSYGFLIKLSEGIPSNSW